MDSDFSPEQRRYLEGLVAGMNAARSAGGGAAAPAEPVGPDAPHLKAMARTEAEGRTLVDQENFKRDEHPHDAYARMKAQAQSGQYPKPQDNFRWRFHGLFYVAPNQNSYMCRLRLPNGILNHWQLAGLAMLATTHGGGYSHITTRANFQIREIPAEKAVSLIEAIQDLGLHTKGSGADNIRNVTGTPTAGVDPQELLDTRPYAREWAYHVLNNRTLHGLPRKFNVAFDGAGKIAALEDTNDIGFQAVEVVDGGGVEPGVWFRLALGGITGHQDFARPTGVYLKPADATRVADAIVRVFIDHGDRTDRTKARLKYLLDAWGFEKFLAAVEDTLGTPLTRIADDLVKDRAQPDRLAHIGVHAQRQSGLNWIGVVLPSGKLTAIQMRGLAEIAAEFGDGDIRLTVWQNLLLSGVPDAHVADAVAAIDVLGLATTATPIRAGLVSCTGNTGCKFAASNTKGTAELIATQVEARLTMDQPVNIHLTGCHHSCAQHYIGDIGLVACKITPGEDQEPIEGFHIYIGGGSGADAKIGREIFRDIPNEQCPSAVESLLGAYLKHRDHDAESFFAFANRHDIATLKTLASEPA
ncbi:MAG: nirA [Devosia sp.]|uniref:NirA family protein n=1 Tax=Devosia sp. TaxID=1871048 RepID=UPI002638A9AE|nr:NirA family protein [Devosia sp.]MDB5586338.1 nirA [Devosia sp.]